MSKIFQRKILESQIRKDRAIIGDVDVTPHVAEECPRWPREDGEDPPDSPCPFVSCKHHLYSEVMDNGSLRIYRPALEVDQLPDTCTIDVAMRGTHGFDVIGHHLGITARQARDDYESAIRKAGPQLAELLARAERDRPGCTDSLELDRRKGGLLATGQVPQYDPRVDDPDVMDRTRPNGFVPIAETRVEIMGQHREIPRLTEEHLMRQYQLPRLAERLYMMLISNAEWRRCGLSDLTTAYQEQTGNTISVSKVSAALDDLELAGLIQAEWRACGKVRRLRGISLVSSLKSVDLEPDGSKCDTQHFSASGSLRATCAGETMDLEE